MIEELLTIEFENQTNEHSTLVLLENIIPIVDISSFKRIEIESILY